MRFGKLVLGVGVCLGLLSAAPVAAMQDASPVPEGAGPMLPENCVVLADGFNSPRYVAVGDDGTVYVTEAGLGGDEPVGQQMATPAADAMMLNHRGYTGQVSAIASDGTVSVVADGLASYMMNGVEATGPAGIEVHDGQLIVAMGGPGPQTPDIETPLENESAVISIDIETGEVTQLADIAAYERSENPDPFMIDTNLYGVAVADDGTVYVNDAGGNATYRIPAGGGEPEVVVVHPGLTPEGMDLPPNPNRDGEAALDPVPTDLVFMDDGTLVSGLLSGGPFPPGAAKAVSVAEDGELADVFTGLTMNVALAVGPDGALYATNFSTNMLAEVPEPGTVVRMAEDGSAEVVVEGVPFANGIAFDGDGNLLVVANALSIGGPTGMVLSCDVSGSAASAGSEEVEIVLRDVFFRSV